MAVAGLGADAPSGRGRVGDRVALTGQSVSVGATGGGRFPAAVSSSRIQSNWTRGRKWAVVGTVVGSLMAVVGATAIIALQNGALVNGHLDFLKPMTLWSAIPLLVNGAGLAIGSGIILHRTKYFPKMSPSDVSEAVVRKQLVVKKGEFFLYQNEATGTLRVFLADEDEDRLQEDHALQDVLGKNEKGRKQVTL